MSSKNSAAQMTRRSFISRSLVGASMVCLPAALFKEIEARADEQENDVVLRFSALSDVHFKVSPEAQEVDRFRRSMSFMYDYSAKQKYPKFDAMLVAGDFSDHGYDEELTLFRKIMDEGIRPGTETILCMGNHEFIRGTKKRWEEIFERDSNKVYKVNGFSFIALSPEKGTCRNGDFNYALDWYKQELANAEMDDPAKPIFTFQHYHVTPTVYGSRGEDNWGTIDLYETLQRYPRVINFSGHSHYPINDPRSAWQGNFTAFGTGTLSYFEMGGEGGRYNKFPEGHRNAAQLYVVEVRKDNSVTLKPYDLITNSFFDVVYYIPKPGDTDTYRYTDERYLKNDRPVWADDAKVSCEILEDDGLVRLSFPQATCSDVVHSYRVDLEKPDADIEIDLGSRYFWSKYYFKNQPKIMTVDLEGLPEVTKCRAKITALNPWFAESEKSLEIDFTTPRDPYAPVDKDAPKPDANMLDVVFVDGKPVNVAKNARKKQKEIKIDGAPKIAANPDFSGAQAATFNGKDDRLKIQFNSRDYGMMKNATIAATFRFVEFTKESQDILACTEGRGVSFEINSGKKQLEFWASINGEYKVLGAPVEPGKTYDAFGTYDGKVLKLYLNGKEAASLDVEGGLTYPSDSSVQAFCVGCDISTGGSGTNYLKGAVSRARVFSWGLSAEQVANLSAK